MRLYLLRHGESEYNVKDLINTNPKIDVSLTKKGVKQAEKAAKKLKKIKFDVILVSEFLRAKQTAEIVNRSLNVRFEVEPMLNEINLGYEGRPDKDFLKAAGNNLLHFRGDGTESWQELKKRVGEFLTEIKKKDFENVLVVSHQWTIRVANGLANGLTDEEAYAVDG
jgi:broad specificity phosphatase PhoE